MAWARTTALLVVLGLVSLAAGPRQGPDLDRVMHRKLAHTQKILEAVVTSDWVLLEEQSRELERATYDSGWAVLKAPEYVAHSLGFRKAVMALHEAAAQRDLEATPKAYVAVTMECVQCHRYLARRRITTP